MKKNKKVLILGGTGAIGRYLVPELHGMGYEVHITSRSERETQDKRVRYIQGNGKDKDFVLGLLDEGCDALVDFMIYHTDEFADRYEAYLQKVPHYLFTSSYRVYGDNGKRPITEESPRLLDSVEDKVYLSTDEYGLTKARQEDLLFSAAQKNWTVVRPAITYSTGRFQLGTMEAEDFVSRALQGKTVIFPRQMLDKQATLSWAGDVGKMIARLVLNEQAMGQVYTASTAEHHSWGEIVKIYRELIGLKMQAVDLAVYRDVMGGEYQIKYDRMLDRVVDNRKILAAVGMTQQELMPLKDGLARELKAFRADPNFRRIDPKKQKKMDEALEKAPSGLRRIVNRGWRRTKDLLKKSRLIRKLADKIKNR